MKDCGIFREARRESLKEEGSVLFLCSDKYFNESEKAYFGTSLDSKLVVIWGYIPRDEMVGRSFSKIFMTDCYEGEFEKGFGGVVSGIEYFTSRLKGKNTRLKFGEFDMFYHN